MNRLMIISSFLIVSENFPYSFAVASDITRKVTSTRSNIKNLRLREKQLRDIQLLVDKNVEDPIAVLKLELEKLEQHYFEQKEQIRIKDNALQAMKDLNDR